MRRAIVALLILAACAVGGFAQVFEFTVPEAADETEGVPAPVDERLQLAVADAQYPVTPGDVYSLSFLQGVELVTSQVLVESDYSVNLGILGEVSGRGKRFAELKPEIEALIAQAYPRSLPSVNIASIGLFQVTLTGAIPQTTRVTVWGLSRLSDVIVGFTGPYTSLRAVTVTSSNGRRQTYDVFRAVDQGAQDQDPFLKPGDSVSFARRGLVVGVQGQVYEPGSYELLPGEGLPDLTRFFQGFSPNAATNRLVVQRQDGEQVVQIPLGSAEDSSRFEFSDGDVLIVPDRVIPRPIVFVEGAVQIAFDVQPDADEQSALPVYNRITRELTVGDTLYSLLLDVQDQISPFADIERGYVIRQDVSDPIRINMREVLYRQSEYNAFVLEPFDRVVIPLDQPYVIVSGDVTLPARYPYNPSAGYQYYLNLAGTGAQSFIDVRERVAVYDREGAPVGLESAIRPGFTVHVFPEQERFVVVSGNVPDPGAYPYQQSRHASYYLRLAGVGAERLTILRDSVDIYDAAGAEQPPGTTVRPDFTVYVPPSVEPLLQGEQFALVTGAVLNPGLQPISGERPAAYYIRQAGGVDGELSSDGSYVITDALGNERAADSAVGSGDTIEVLRNGFVYNFNRYFPVITAGLTFITTIITLVTTLNQ